MLLIVSRLCCSRYVNLAMHIIYLHVSINACATNRNELVLAYLDSAVGESNVLLLAYQ